MRKKLLFVLLFIVCIGLLNARDIYVVNSTSATLSKINTEDGTVTNDYAQLGTTPNWIDINDGYAYVTNSGDNSVQKIDLETGATVSNIYVADSSNPWYAKAHEGFLYVTGYFTGSLYKIDLITEEIVEEVSVGVNPEGIEIADGKLYVACAGDYGSNYEGSRVLVLGLAQLNVLSVIETSLNPQHIKAYNGLIYVMCTGNWSSVMGQIEVIDPTNNQIIASIPTGVSIGKAAFLNDRAYISESNNTGIYVIDLNNNTLVENIENPLTPGGSTIATDGQVLAYVNSNWGSNGTVHVTDNSIQNSLSYEVALYPTDIIFAENTTPNSNSEVELAQLDISCYPNPMQGSISIKLDNPAKTTSKISIYNIKGQFVKQFSTSSSLVKWNGLDMNNKTTASGLYLVKVKNGNQSYQSKFIKLK